jgi:putative ATP-binding cassette transporter
MTNNMMSLPWKRLWKIGKPFWTSDVKWKALLHLGVVLLLMFANTAIAVYINKAAGNFMTSIEQRNVDDFYHFMMIYGLALVGAMPIINGYGYMRTRLALSWRRWLAQSMINKYFANQAYYKLIRNPDVDNPDQRITQDVDSFCNTSVGLFISILDSIVTILSFATVLWALSPMLTWTVIGYSAVGSVVVVLIGKSLSGLAFQQFKTEADLRFGLAEARREAESIAFYRAEEIAATQSGGRLRTVINTLISVANVYRNIAIFTTPYNMLVALIPAAMIAPLYFERAIAFGHITQAVMAFGAVFNGATFLISQFGGISNYTAIINRLGSFLEAVEAAGDDPLPVDKRIAVVDGYRIAFDKVTVLTPDLARALVLDLTVDVPNGQGLLIVGPDGSGKSSLLRTVASMWNAGSGTLTRPVGNDIMFLTQTPYLPKMTLRQAMCYSLTHPCQDDARLMQVLNLVNLEDLSVRAGGLDVEKDWHDFVSMSELQRLSLARVILRKPRYVVIDEATSALEQDNERLLYTLLASLGATVVSTGNPNSLVKYHTKVLELAGDGTWTVHPADQYKPKSTQVRINPVIQRFTWRSPDGDK